MEASWRITEYSNGVLKVEFTHINPVGEVDSGILNGIRRGRQLTLKNEGIQIDLDIVGNRMTGYIYRLENGAPKYVLETVDFRKIPE